VKGDFNVVNEYFGKFSAAYHVLFITKTFCLTSEAWKINLNSFHSVLFIAFLDQGQRVHKRLIVYLYALWVKKKKLNTNIRHLIVYLQIFFGNLN